MGLECGECLDGAQVNQETKIIEFFQIFISLLYSAIWIRIMCNKNARQHHPNGNMELLWQIGLNMNLDPATLDTVDGFKEFLYLTQVWEARTRPIIQVFWANIPYNRINDTDYFRCSRQLLWRPRLRLIEEGWWEHCVMCMPYMTIIDILTR